METCCTEVRKYCNIHILRPSSSGEKRTFRGAGKNAASMNRCTAKCSRPYSEIIVIGTSRIGKHEHIPGFCRRRSCVFRVEHFGEVSVENLLPRLNPGIMVFFRILRVGVRSRGRNASGKFRKYRIWLAGRGYRSGILPEYRIGRIFAQVQRLPALCGSHA